MRFFLKTTLFICYMIVSSPAARADENNTLFCTKLGELAGRSMAARLQGKPVEELLKVKFDPAVHEIFQGIIKEAYRRPLAQGDDAVVKNMTDYRNIVEEHCLSSLKQ